MRTIYLAIKAVLLLIVLFFVLMWEEYWHREKEGA